MQPGLWNVQKLPKFVHPPVLSATYSWFAEKNSCSQSLHFTSLFPKIAFPEGKSLVFYFLTRSAEGFPRLISNFLLKLLNNISTNSNFLKKFCLHNLWGNQTNNMFENHKKMSTKSVFALVFISNLVCLVLCHEIPLQYSEWIFA